MSTLSLKAAKTTAATYSLSQGISTGASICFSVYDASHNIGLSVLSAAVGGSADTANSLCFQGKSILESIETQNDNAEKELNQTQNALPSKLRQCCSYFSQSAYLLFDNAKNFSNRYFLITALQQCTKITLSSGVFWATLSIDFVIKQLFAMSNETFETISELTNKIIPGADVFYKNIFKPISNNSLRLCFRIVGSAEHALVDDIISWMPLLLSSPAAQFLSSSETIPRIILSLSGVIGVTLTLALFSLVYFFEGEHTEKTLKDIHGDLLNSNVKPFSKTLYYILKYTIKVTPIVHGLSSCSNVYYSLLSLTNLAPLAIILSILVFIGTTVGTHYSEAREAAEELEKRKPLSLQPQAKEALLNGAV